MKSLIKFLVWPSFIILIILNVVVFLESIQISDRINYFEKETKIFHQQNSNLENDIYKVDSLQYTSTVASQLNFTVKAQPVYLENLKYARSQ